MFFFRGVAPRFHRCVQVAARDHRITGVALCALLTGAWANGNAVAQDTANAPTPLSMAEAEQLALTEEPGQMMFEARASALRDQSVAAGQLPDPKLRLGLMNYPIEAGNFRSEGMTQVQLGVHQAFPPGDTRAARHRRFQSLADAAQASSAARGREVLTDVREAWLDSYYLTRARDILTESRPYFEDLLRVTTSLYEVGRKSQQDVLRAELELSRLENSILETNRQRLAALAGLSEWVGSASSRPIEERLPAWDSLPDLAALRDGLASHPTLAAAEARIAARDAEVAAQKEGRKSGWALDFGYGYRDGRQANGLPRSDFVSLSVTADLPLFRRNRQDRTLAAAISERTAAREAHTQLLRRLGSQLETEFILWRELGRRIDLYDREILSQASQHAQAALSAYQSEAGDFSEVMRSYISERDVRLEYLRLKTERAKTYARIANLGGLSP